MNLQHLKFTYGVFEIKKIQVISLRILKLKLLYVYIEYKNTTHVIYLNLIAIRAFLTPGSASDSEVRFQVIDHYP